jgi:hypothetical protein
MHTEVLLDARKKVGLEENPEKTKYVYVNVILSEGRIKA